VQMDSMNMMPVRQRYFRVPAVVLLIALLAGCGADSKERMLENGNKKFEQKKYREAAIFYQKALEKDPKFGEAYFRLGKTFMLQGRPAVALRSLKRASELQENNSESHGLVADILYTAYIKNPVKNKPLLGELSSLSQRLLQKNRKSFQGLRMKGMVHEVNGETSEAIEAFTAASEVTPGNPDVVIALGRVYVRAGKNAEAGQLVRSELAKNSKVPGYYKFLYLLEVGQNQFDKAEEVLKSQIDNFPDKIENHRDLALHYLGTQKANLMKATLEKLVADQAKFPNARQVVGDFYAQFGDLTEALKHYRAGVTENRKNRLSYEKKVVELLSLQLKFAEATKVADELRKDFPDDAELKALRAALRLQTHDPKQVEMAVSEFLAVLSKLPGDPGVRFNLGEAYLSQKNLTQAETQFREAIKLRANYPPPILSLGRIHYVRGDFAKAKQAADDVLRLVPRSIPAHILRATSNLGMKDEKAARTELDAVRKLDPDNSDATYLIARLDLRDKKFPEAETGFKKLREKGQFRGLFGLAEVFMQTNRGEEALQAVEAELQKNGSSTDLQLAYGNLNVRMRHYEKAEEIFRNLVAKAPTSVDYLKLLAETYRYSGKIDESLQTLDKVSKLVPKDAAPLLEMASIYERTGRLEKLEALYRQILTIEPDRAVALNNLAFIMADSGKDLDQALGYVQRAKQLTPNDPDVSDTLGLVYIKKGLSDEAIRIFNGLLSKQPNHVTWRYHLALAYQLSGQRLKAKQELAIASKNNPTDIEARKIRELLTRIGG